MIITQKQILIEGLVQEEMDKKKTIAYLIAMIESYRVPLENDHDEVYRVLDMVLDEVLSGRLDA